MNKIVMLNFIVFLLLPAHSLYADVTTAKLAHWDQAERRLGLEAIKSSPANYASQPIVSKVATMTTQDQNCGVRTLAAETLESLAAHIDISASDSQLKKALQDKIPSVRKAALDTLCAENKGGAIEQSTMEKLLEDSDRSVRMSAKTCNPHKGAPHP